MQQLQAHSVCLPPSEDYPFYVTAKRYAHPAFQAHDYSRSSNGAPPLTLLFLHSTGFHKEIYEPVLETLFGMTARGEFGIREAWAVDCPNHGESAVWNSERLLRPPHDQYFSCERYAEAVYRFLKVQDRGDPYVKTNSDRLVCVGHSLGGCAAIFLSAKVSFTSMILIDPFLYPGGQVENFVQMRRRLVDRAHERRDVWRDRNEAYEFLRKKGEWDDRVMQLYVKYGVREHPHVNRTLAPYKGVTLACTREQEATMYRDDEGASKPLQQLNAICQKIPVHVTFGDQSNVIPREIQENIIDPTVRHFASIEWIKDVGHLVPHQAPRAVAKFIYNALAQNEQTQARL